MKTPSSGRHAMGAALLSLMLYGLATAAGADEAKQTANLQEACSAFVPGGLPHGASVSKAEVRAAHGGFPEACIVRGTLVSSPTSTITWAVELPARDKWNGKTLTIGGGGFDGFIPTDMEHYNVIAGPTAASYVRMSSDSGHQVRTFYPWAMDAMALRNHAFEANNLTLQVGTQLATQFYGRRPSRRYMIGQSNGGRSGLVSIQRHPENYDGIIALEPAIFQQAHESNLGSTTMRHIFSDEQNWLSEAKVALFAKAEIKACDALDGLEDGIIGNIEACHYIPTDLMCKGAESDSCLTAGQIETIRMIYSDHNLPIKFGDGSEGYPKFGRGGAATSDWTRFLFGTSFEAQDAFDFMVSVQAAKVVEKNGDATNFGHDPRKFAAQYLELSKLMDPTDPDLSPYADRGGKLLIYYGLADACVPVYRTAQYFDAVKNKMGAAKVATFARFLGSPGVGHNHDGPGAGVVDLVSAMDNWVEHGVAPDHLVVTKLDAASSQPLLQRPLCEYPKFPRYKGSGDPSKADSFQCADH